MDHDLSAYSQASRALRVGNMRHLTVSSALDPTAPALSPVSVIQLNRRALQRVQSSCLEKMHYCVNPIQVSHQRLLQMFTWTERLN